MIVYLVGSSTDTILDGKGETKIGNIYNNIIVDFVTVLGKFEWR